MPLYFLAIIPSQEICEQIKLLKLEIAQKYEAKHALKLPAHITLQIPFKLSQNQEERIIEVLNNFAKKQESFQVELKDFGRFTHKVIFVNILRHNEITELHAELQAILNKNFNLKKHESFSKIHPHITLASRDLSYKEFPGAWEDFKKREFKAAFYANELVLFKHDGKLWHRHLEFKFN
ncbi:2'-5' RNA ligase [Salegentibacter sp. 24]|uniref:2'-5' RNA ligase family protein n=1 Tax=Salegentibacter sp. 24 TaxID=2183986 RepID=UPI00105F0923|nr:2'-5' RNA ligase family protein [Salegentibacter sp. 24]TDN82763.1 2'-5' RNA ligase [Salegentibacter sp. 24]